MSSGGLNAITKLPASPRKALSNITNISSENILSSDDRSSFLSDVTIEIAEDLSIGNVQDVVHVLQDSGLGTTLSDTSLPAHSPEPDTPASGTENNTESNTTTSKRSLTQIREDSALHHILQNFDGQELLMAYDRDRQRLAECYVMREEFVPLFSPVDLCKVVLKYELYKSNNESPTPSTYLKYAKLLCEYLGLPLECIPQFYSQGYRKGKKVTSAKGHLPNAMASIRKKSRKRQGITVPEKSDDDILEDTDETDEIVINKTYIDSWILGALKRYKAAMKCTIQEQFKNNPCYTNPNAVDLFKADHATLFPSSDQLLLTDWPNIAKKIIVVAEMYRKRSKLIENILTENSEMTSSAQIQNVALALVPLILVALAKSAKSVGKKWRPTPQEISDSFLLQVPNLTELESKRSTYETMLTSHNEPVQPYAILVGQLRKVDYTYAVVNKRVYSMASPLHAIDLCYKVCKIMRASSSKLSYDAYKFLAFHVYKDLEGSHNANVGSLSGLLSVRADHQPNADPCN
ncbi:hypothetical protein QAD02_012598 [Eretmocerus hayati]|uniref:Uncharacterized protein n=1 Tax=Eretmocerus hayati TaxID=131215 RepID=A0ACC2P1W1_9HYME|nr:hypothetical protein QAD02_012598 [Eretmocerus hayati]